MKNIKGKSVLILGLGISGLAMARWCVRYAAKVTIVDTRAAPPQLASLREDLPSVLFINNIFSPELILHDIFDLLLISPGIKPVDIETTLLSAKSNNIEIANELTLFSQALATLKESFSYAPCVLAITGTNGKTTVTSLAGKLVERAGKSVVVAGNIGPSLLDTLIKKFDLNELPEVWVLELSSFQLHEVQEFEPTAGVVLNLTQDHLDWHGSMQAYGYAKSLIFGKNAMMVLNREDAAVMQMLQQLGNSNSSRKFITFGADMPQRAGDYGLEIVNGIIWLVKAIGIEETVSKRKSPNICVKENVYIQRMMPADALQIRGRHNIVNALVSLSLSELAGCALAPMLYALREYRGEPHRVESVGIINEVEYFDDSKGTNVGATVAALNGLGADRKVVVILGGESKGQDFSPLLKPVDQYARAIVLMGRDKFIIKEALRDSKVPMVIVETMLEAVSAASEQACKGDAVVMSPACASFDMFENYEHRGRAFCFAVQDVANQSDVSSVL